MVVESPDDDAASASRVSVFDIFETGAEICEVAVWSCEACGVDLAARTEE